MENKQNIDLGASDVSVILLLVNNPSFKTSEKTYNLKLFGKSMKEWVALAVKEAEIKEVETKNSQDIISTITPHLTDKKYTIVLYSDTPLLTAKTFSEIIEYIKVKKLSALQLKRGYAFETQHIKNIEKVYSPQTVYFNEEDFIPAYNQKQLAMINNVLKNRILNYHFNQGVRIMDVASTYIDAEVEIDEDVVIYPNNTIKGKSMIDKGVTLYENNVIKNSYILKNSQISSSYIFDSIIGKHCGVGPFAYIQDESVMQKSSQVGAFVELRKGKLSEKARVRRLSFVGKEDLD
jgi:bifunctional N-acetylglucosamine-1-phosphate-uridyltransferase/glucosamine-1-phosphate-acetyltransferase GlmU-like protein